MSGQPASDGEAEPARIITGKPMRRVILESPHKGDIEANLAYARAAVRDCIMRGESAIASHLLFTQPGILDDEIPKERELGIDAGLAWLAVADATVVYIDHGTSDGMQYGIDLATKAGIPVEYRFIEPEWTE